MDRVPCNEEVVTNALLEFVNCHKIRAQAAQSLGVSPSYLCRLLENDRSMPTKVAKILGYQLAWIKKGPTHDR